MSTSLLILFGLVFVSALFSASETALIAITNSKVDELVTNKVRNAKLLKKLKSNPHRLLSTVLVGNNIINIGASAYAAIVFTDFFGSNGIGIATGFMTVLILIFGEIVPKSFATQFAAPVSLFSAKPIYVLQLILFPLIWIFDRIVELVNLMLGRKAGNTVTEGEIMAMLKIGTQEGTIERQERELIENVLEFNDIEVEEVMTPRVNVEALDCELTIQEAVDKALKYSHSRLPVYQGSVDNIIGILYIKELLRYYDEYSVKKKLKTLKLLKPIEVPFSKKINKLFRDLQRRHQHMAVVMDEHGGTAGIVTMEDLLEEIVGDIVDESDLFESPIEVVDKNTIVVKGTALVEDVNDYFNIELDTSERDTINTMILDHLHRFAREGEDIMMPRVKIHILKMKGNVVEKVEIKKRRNKTIKRR